MTVLQKQPSEELLSLIKAAANSFLGFAELWGSIKKKGSDEGFSERDLQEILKPLLKERLTANQIRYLFHREEEVKRSQDNRQNAAYVSTKIPDNDAKKDTEQKSNWDEEVEDIIKKEVPAKDSEQFYKEQQQQPEDDPRDTEIEFQKEKIAQLEDALKKSPMFLDAGKLSSKEVKEIKDDLASSTTIIQTPQDYEKEVFEFLSKRHDGVTCFWFPNYGRVLFKNRIMSQLENSGVKTFKRLYFEV